MVWLMALEGTRSVKMNSQYNDQMNGNEVNQSLIHWDTGNWILISHYDCYLAALRKNTIVVQSVISRPQTGVHIVMKLLVPKTYGQMEPSFNERILHVGFPCIMSPFKNRPGHCFSLKRLNDDRDAHGFPLGHPLMK